MCDVLIEGQYKIKLSLTTFFEVLHYLTLLAIRDGVMLALMPPKIVEVGSSSPTLLYTFSTSLLSMIKAHDGSCNNTLSLGNKI